MTTKVHYPMAKSASAAYLQTHTSHHANAIARAASAANLGAPLNAYTFPEDNGTITLMGEPLDQPLHSAPIYQRVQQHVQSRATSASTSTITSTRRSSALQHSASAKRLTKVIERKPRAIEIRRPSKELRRAIDSFKCDFGYPTWGQGKNAAKVYKAQKALKDIFKNTLY
jgi:hypothetical protein